MIKQSANEITDKLRKAIIEHLGVQPESLTREATFEDLGADSLNMVELSMTFEEIFGIEISDDLAEQTTTVGAAFDAIIKAVDAK